MDIASEGGFWSSADGYTSFDPANKSSAITLSNSNRTATVDGGVTNLWYSARSFGPVSGKRYFEIYISAIGAYCAAGVCGSTFPVSASDTFPGIDTNSWGYLSPGWTYYNSAQTSGRSSFTTGDVIGVAFDTAAGKVWFAKNNTWQASGDPANGTNPIYTGLPSALYGVGAGHKTGVVISNFKSSEQTYAPPSGFTAVG